HSSKSKGKQMLDQEWSGDRRIFLASMAVSAAALGLHEVNEAAQTSDTSPSADVPTEIQVWLSTISGKNRQVYDAPEPNNGMALMWSHVYLVTAAQGYNVPESDVGVVVVLRHAAIPIGFQDPLWSKYKLGEVFKITDPATKGPALRNPFNNIKADDMPIPDAALDKLVARGVKFAVCNMAITHYSGMLARQMDMPAEKVKQEWVEGILPGVTVVPSGVVAVNGAQSRGCTYCFAG